MKLTQSMERILLLLNDEQKAVWDAIPEGYKNAVSRPYLVNRTGLNDRHIRSIVAELVSLGLPLGSSTNGSRGGYFKIATLQDLRMARHMKGRALKLLKRDRALEKVGVELFGVTPTLFDDVTEAVS